MYDFASLSECMTDGDLESLDRARRSRTGAMALALCLEALTVGALLIWPLMHLGVLGKPVELLPSPMVFSPRPIISAPEPVSGARPRSFGFQLPSFHPSALVRHSAEGDATPPGEGLLGDPNGNVVTGLVGLGQGTNPVTLAPPAQREQAMPPRVSIGVMDAMLVQKVQPDYPSIAKAMHLAGTVRLHAIIGTDGSVRELRLIEGNPILAGAAMNAVRQWRYRPTMLGSQPVEVETYVTVNFVLQQQ
jgi:protein TonB